MTLRSVFFILTRWRGRRLTLGRYLSILTDIAMLITNFVNSLDRKTERNDISCQKAKWFIDSSSIKFDLFAYVEKQETVYYKNIHILKLAGKCFTVTNVKRIAKL